LGTDARAYHASTAGDTLAVLGSSPDGLAFSEAARRLELHGLNELPAARPDPLWRLVVRQLRSAIALLLLAGVALSLLAGDRLDAIAISAVLLLNMAIGVAMEAGAGRALSALRKLETPRALVTRDGVTQEIAAARLVPGDVLLLEEGVRVPADVRLLEATELRINEALLTGESAVVEKDATAVLDPQTPLAERRTMAYQGSVVAAGRGRAIVVATGTSTELGRIGALVERVRPVRTSLERKLDTLGRQLAAAALVLALAVIVLGLIRGMAVDTLVRLGIALAVAAVPEGLPAVATIALAVGVRRMARRHALVRQLPVVESLGSVTVVCADKTGTLTAGAMTVTSVWCAGRAIAVTGSGFEPRGEFQRDGNRIDPAADGVLSELLRCGALAARATVDQSNGIWQAVGDPTDAALVTVAGKAGLTRSTLLHEEPVAWEVPFSSARMLSVSAHRRNGAIRVYAKGSPRSVLDLCDRWLTDTGVAPLTDHARHGVERANESFSEAGLRVLAIAFVDGSLEQAVPRAMTLVGLVAMTDPPAEGVPETVAALRTAGVRTVMVTGDQRATASAIARQLGLQASGEESLDARDLDALDDEALSRRLPAVTVFSRVSPDEKLRLVDAYQRQGDLVAMLGDGVNDAPALRRADVGVAMGRRGTDVAKEAADIVLQDDRFSSIVAALEQGRIIYDNLRKFVYYLISCNLAELLILIAFPLTGTPLPFTALQILWLNLVTDTIPALALAAEPGDSLVMQRPPRRPEHGLLSRSLLASAVGHALLITVATLAAFALTTDSGRAGTVAFLTLAVAQVLHLGNARSTLPTVHPRRLVANPMALAAAALSLAIVAATSQWSPLARVLSLDSIGPTEWAVVMVIGALPAVAGQIWRWLRAGQRRSAD
jgi:Ca2+-transporting ATPase